MPEKTAGIKRLQFQKEGIPVRPERGCYQQHSPQKLKFLSKILEATWDMTVWLSALWQINKCIMVFPPKTEIVLVWVFAHLPPHMCWPTWGRAYSASYLTYVYTGTHQIRVGLAWPLWQPLLSSTETSQGGCWSCSPKGKVLSVLRGAPG